MKKEGEVLRFKLKCGDVYDTDVHPTLQNLSEEGIKEAIEIKRRLDENRRHPYLR